MPKIEINVHIISVTPLRVLRFMLFMVHRPTAIHYWSRCCGVTKLRCARHLPDALVAPTPTSNPAPQGGSTRRIHHAVPGAMVSKSRFGCVNRSHLWLASAAVTAQLVPLISAFPDWHWEIRHIVVDGENIAVHFTVTGTHRGPFQGIEATGRRVTTSEFTFYHIEDGKFAEVWDLTDMDAVMRQIRQGEAPSTTPC